MRKESNTELRVTITKNQYKYIEEMSKKLKITKSQFIAWIISKKANELLELKAIRNGISQEQFEEICRVAKTNWLEDQAHLGTKVKDKLSKNNSNKIVTT